MKPWKDFSKINWVFSITEKHLEKSAFSFDSFSLGKQRKWTHIKFKIIKKLKTEVQMTFIQAHSETQKGQGLYLSTLRDFAAK